MPTTALGFRYPAGTAYPNVPQDLQNLATDIDNKLYKGGPTVTALAINAGWHAAVGFAPPAVYKDASGLICLTGMISNDNAFSGTSNTMFTLPTGFRPVYQKAGPVPVNMGAAGIIAQLLILTSGAASISRSAAIDANLIWDLSVIRFHPTA